MQSYRKGDLVSISGRVQHVEGDYIMVALDGALDDTPPAMVFMSSARMIRASVHVGDEVEGGYKVHSVIDGTPLVLLRLISGDPADPDTFRTALLDSLFLVSAAGAEADVATVDAEAPRPADPVVAAQPQIQNEAPAPEPLQTAAPVDEHADTESPRAVDEESTADTSAPSNDAGASAASSGQEERSSQDDVAPSNVQQAAPTPADMRQHPTNVVSMEAPSRPSLASLGVVREQPNPLKASEDELLLHEVIDDDKGVY